ncbi:MAG: hypothetical protein HOV68_33635 [Streptomycetaceae bacterium]|nr:hypothetical protein [Streptomycetaceae bacterium]
MLTASCTVGSPPRRATPQVTVTGATPAPLAPGAGAPSMAPVRRDPVTAAQAEQILDRYSRVNASANAAFDAALLGTVEGGALYDLSRAGYRQRTTMTPAELAANREGFEYVERAFYLPANTTWFAVTARAKDRSGTSAEKVLVIVDRDANNAWKVVASAWIAEADLPRIAVVAGRPVAVQDTAAVRGLLAPDALPAAFADLYATGGSGPGKVFADTPAAAQARAVPEAQNKVLAPDGTAAYTPGTTAHRTVYALQTADGGTLAVFNTAVREDDRGTRPDATLYPSPAMAAFTGNLGASAFRVDYLHQSAAYLPPQGQAKLIATRQRIIAVQSPQPADVTS